jgi:hypothetical protein
MKRLRHPIRAIREPFGTAGLIVALVALVAALGGTALAASKLNSTQKKEVEKIAKKFAGKPGTNGANGSNGAKGDTGSAGAPGAPGTGTAGAAGVSPTGTTFSGARGACSEGGVEYKGATTNLVCNGKKGTTGTNGSPWTLNGTLPSEATETGAWTIYAGSDPGGPEFGERLARTAITFNVPLAAPLQQSEYGLTAGCNAASESCPIQARGLGYDGTDKTGSAHEECPGTAAEPKAAAGFLCVYTGARQEFQLEYPAVTSPAVELTATEFDSLAFPESTSTAGAVIALPVQTGATHAYITGTWAVTAE